jgi:uncharacterized protein (DUF1697 family)
MPRYVAFLRGVSPMNAKMSELTRCFEAAGFANVRTVLGSGNVVFDHRASTNEAVERRAEEAMQLTLGKVFRTTVRSVDHLRSLLESRPFAQFELPADAKCVITFLRRAPRAAVALPVERDGARILQLRGTEVLTAYVPSAAGPVFMQMLDRTFGKDITTRTIDTLRKCVLA